MHACLFALALVAGDPEPASLSGIYHVSGEEEGQKYNGVAIVAEDGDKIGVHWCVGPFSTLGIGVRKGDHVALRWKAYRSGQLVGEGVTLYRIDGKRFEGSRMSGDEVNPEQMRFLRPLADKEV